VHGLVGSYPGLWRPQPHHFPGLEAREAGGAPEAGLLPDAALLPRTARDFHFIEPTAYERLDELEALIAHYKARYNIAAIGVDDIHNQMLTQMRANETT